MHLCARFGLLLFVWGGVTCAFPSGGARAPSEEPSARAARDRLLQASCRKPPQFIVTSFDGLPDTELLRFSRNHPARFTFFVSSVYFVTDAEGKLYRAPGRRPGQSRLGFGGDAAHVARNRALTLEAIALGHEVGSHGNGHFSGAAYSRQAWEGEMRYFAEQTLPWIRRRFPEFAPLGFRAPGLDTSRALPGVLLDFRFEYASNTYDRRTARPRSPGGRPYELPISVVRVLNGRRSILAMDYNIQVVHEEAGRRFASVRYADTREAYRRLLDDRLRTDRSPIHLAHHTGPVVATDYRFALLDFLSDACGQAEVLCVRCIDLVRWYERCGAP